MHGDADENPGGPIEAQVQALERASPPALQGPGSLTNTTCAAPCIHAIHYGQEVCHHGLRAEFAVEFPFGQELIACNAYVKSEDAPNCGEQFIFFEFET